MMLQFERIALIVALLAAICIMVVIAYYAYRCRQQVGTKVLLGVRDQIFETMSEGVLVLDLKNRIEDYNPAAQRILKGVDAKAIGMNAAEILQAYPELLNQVFANQEQVEVKIVADNLTGYFCSRLSPIANSAGEVTGKSIILTDVTKQVVLVEKLKSLATLDELTNVFNRRHFLETCRQELTQMARYGGPVSVIIADLDFFKQVNDVYGHKAGDITLAAVAGIFKSGLRQVDVLGRVGGEEFAVLLPQTPADQAGVVAERLRSDLAKAKINIGGTDVNVTASFGVAGLAEVSGVELEYLLNKADEAMYLAKRQGRNRVVIASANQEAGS